MSARYRIYAGDIYYPNGGHLDFIRSAHTLDEARRICEQLPNKDEARNRYNVRWCHIVEDDQITMEATRDPDGRWEWSTPE